QQPLEIRALAQRDEIGSLLQVDDVAVAFAGRLPQRLHGAGSVLLPELGALSRLVLPGRPQRRRQRTQARQALERPSVAVFGQRLRLGEGLAVSAIALRPGDRPAKLEHGAVLSI